MKYTAKLIDGQPAVVGFNEVEILMPPTMESAEAIAQTRNDNLKKELMVLLRNLGQILADLAYDASMPYGLDIQGTELERIEDQIEQARNLLSKAKSGLEQYLK